LVHNIVPNYANIRIRTANHSEAARRTQTLAQHKRVKYEIDMLYKKKARLNKLLYKLHLNNANTWGNTWHIIYENINNTMKVNMNGKYRMLNDKLHHLMLNNRTNTQQQQHHTFYQRVSNLTNITFTNDELTLLNKGLKYNLHNTPKNWLHTLAIDADTAISLLHPHEQVYMRKIVANKLKGLINRHTHTQRSNRHNRLETTLIKSIKQKLIQNNAMATKADKGNTLVIIYINEYDQKIQEFIADNQFTEVDHTYTKKQQHITRDTINKCKNTIHPKDKWKYHIMNPETPKIHGTIKLTQYAHQTSSKLET
jgi:hypothetical protein